MQLEPFEPLKDAHTLFHGYEAVQHNLRSGSLYNSAQWSNGAGKYGGARRLAAKYFYPLLTTCFNLIKVLLECSKAVLNTKKDGKKRNTPDGDEQRYLV